MKTAIVVIIYNRSENLPRLFARIALARPERVYIIADYADLDKDKILCDHARKIAESEVTWNCQVHKIFAKEHMGLRRRVVTGLNHVFKSEDQAIILEDDLLPDKSFFLFCDQMLRKYHNNDRIISISGSNFIDSGVNYPNSYYFSKYVHSWGWATWKRAWRLYDDSMMTWAKFKVNGWLSKHFPTSIERWYWTNIFDLTSLGKIDSWAYRWTFTALSHNLLTIIPKVNLVKNIGYGKNATNTILKRNILDMSATSIVFPLVHPFKIQVNQKNDNIVSRRVYVNSINIISLFMRSLVQ